LKKGGKSDKYTELKERKDKDLNLSKGCRARSQRWDEKGNKKRKRLTTDRAENPRESLYWARLEKGNWRVLKKGR